jgi:glycosyltransferase involved in cell wall biosynthesis
MKKLVIITSVPINISTWLKGQPKFLSQFFEVEIVTSFSNNIKKIADYEGVKINNIEFSRRFTPLRDLISLFQLIKYLYKFKPDIVYSLNPKSGLLGMIAARVTNIPVRMHCVVGLVYFGSKGFRKKILVCSEKITYFFSTNLYCNSKNLANFIEKNLTNREVRTIGYGSINGIDTIFFKKKATSFEKEKIRKELGFVLDDFIITFIGRIVKDKGIDDLVAAFSELSKKHNNLKLLIIGSYDDNLNSIHKDTKNQIENSNKIKRLNFQNDIRRYLEVSSLFVLPSHREGFPNVLLEAGSFELPLVASNINGCNEVIENGENGLLFDKKDVIDLTKSIDAFINNNDLYNKAKKNIRKTVISKYSKNEFNKNLYFEMKKLLQG